MGQEDTGKQTGKGGYKAVLRESILTCPQGIHSHFNLFQGLRKGEETTLNSHLER